jgi:hypothetical protein
MHKDEIMYVCVSVCECVCVSMSGCAQPDLPISYQPDIWAPHFTWA